MMMMMMIWATVHSLRRDFFATAKTNMPVWCWRWKIIQHYLKVFLWIEKVRSQHATVQFGFPVDSKNEIWYPFPTTSRMAVGKPHLFHSSGRWRDSINNDQQLYHTSLTHEICHSSHCWFSLRRNSLALGTCEGSPALFIFVRYFCAQIFF